jgi:hypothetical protein
MQFQNSSKQIKSFKKKIKVGTIQRKKERGKKILEEKKNNNKQTNKQANQCNF